MKHDSEDHHHGFEHDLRVLTTYAAQRRSLLKLALGLGALPIVACAVSNEDGFDASGGEAGAAGSGTTDGNGDGSCAVIPEETEGPYPGDGTNGANALVLSGIVRSDIRSSIAGSTGVAEGIELRVTLTLLDTQNDCAPLAGHAVYLWHCDRAGNYSMYSADAAGENYLRGVQETDENGQVTFTTIFPACYAGRWPHIHFEIYPSLEMATTGLNKVATSQLALPEAECNAVYATTGYEQSVRNLADVSLESDGIFRDGVALQLASMGGSVSEGYAAALDVGI